MYAQVALVCKDNVDNAIQRCYGMQELRHEYKILDSYEQGSRYLQKIFDFLPRNLLSLSFGEQEGTYIFVNDMNAFDPKVFTSRELVDEWMVAIYYCHLSFSPDIETMRKGYICFVECEGCCVGSRAKLKHFEAFFQQFCVTILSMGGAVITTLEPWSTNAGLHP